jgi:hypothetical protein
MAAIHAWVPLVRTWRVPTWAWLTVLLTPLPWVHLRSAYVDLPVGLLAAALLGTLLQEGRPSHIGWAAAVMLVAFKDEGLAHVVTATLAAVVAGRRRWVWGPLVLAGAWVVGWRVRLWTAGAANVDHALGWPVWREVVPVGVGLAQHATEMATWGVFWALAFGALVRLRGPYAGALRTALLLGLSWMVMGLLVGTERMRAFAANGTLLNRLLIQLWPLAALAVVAWWSPGSAGPEGPEQNETTLR